MRYEMRNIQGNETQNSNLVGDNQHADIHPLVVEFFSAYKDIDEWVKPSESTHMWTAKMPTDLQEGSHIIKISTTDMFNNEFTAYQIFNIK